MRLWLQPDGRLDATSPALPGVSALPIDTPAPTGYWVFGTLPTPADNTVWFEPVRPSSLVLGHIPYPHAERLPDCATMAQQPCRANTVPGPEGPGPAAPS
ncbi:hypothetical protein [Nocardia otitidiscaviarum]|uniref:hypothetical protein n=1 Tax=Nocardia otitidiscaviarum TaxID=1823 RepID=UPI002456F64C|nr:hypothetical protein [Nocardia otitidiscaviarum]